MDGGPTLFDLRFADDTLIFVQSRVEAGTRWLSSWIAFILVQAGEDNGHHESGPTFRPLQPQQE